jgi:geranylgeranyl pyrophosphate synthase
MILNFVTGELMQLDTGATEEERFSQYIDKTFKKTASVFAYSCQAVCFVLISTLLTKLKIVLKGVSACRS